MPMPNLMTDDEVGGISSNGKPLTPIPPLLELPPFITMRRILRVVLMMIGASHHGINRSAVFTG